MCRNFQLFTNSRRRLTLLLKLPVILTAFLILSAGTMPNCGSDPPTEPIPFFRVAPDRFAASLLPGESLNIEMELQGADFGEPQEMDHVRVLLEQDSDSLSIEVDGFDLQWLAEEPFDPVLHSETQSIYISWSYHHVDKEYGTLHLHCGEDVPYGAEWSGFLRFTQRLNPVDEIVNVPIELSVPSAFLLRLSDPNPSIYVGETATFLVEVQRLDYEGPMRIMPSQEDGFITATIFPELVTGDVTALSVTAHPWATPGLHPFRLVVAWPPENHIFIEKLQVPLRVVQPSDDDQAPEIILIAPGDGNIFWEEVVVIEAGVNDESIVTRVGYRVDEGPIEWLQITPPIGIFSVPFVGLSNGRHDFIVLAEDEHGNRGEEQVWIEMRSRPTALACGELLVDTSPPDELDMHIVNLPQYRGRVLNFMSPDQSGNFSVYDRDETLMATESFVPGVTYSFFQFNPYPYTEDTSIRVTTDNPGSYHLWQDCETVLDYGVPSSVLMENGGPASLAVGGYVQYTRAGFFDDGLSNDLKCDFMNRGGHIDHHEELAELREGNYRAGPVLTHVVGSYHTLLVAPLGTWTPGDQDLFRVAEVAIDPAVTLPNLPVIERPGNIGSIGDGEFFTFEGSAGQSLRFTLAHPADSQLAGRLRVGPLQSSPYESQSAAVVDINTDATVRGLSVDWVLPETGVYVIEVGINELPSYPITWEETQGGYLLSVIEP